MYLTPETADLPDDIAFSYVWNRGPEKKDLADDYSFGVKCIGYLGKGDDDSDRK